MLFVTFRDKKINKQYKLMSFKGKGMFILRFVYLFYFA